MNTHRSDEEDSRPTPDELLDRYQLRDAQPGGSESDQVVGRGRLRIYVGMAAGVGKTFAMLNEGRRRKARGADVVVGYVEAHKRPLTEAQVGELEVVPRKQIAYRGIT